MKRIALYHPFLCLKIKSSGRLPGGVYFGKSFQHLLGSLFIHVVPVVHTYQFISGVSQVIAYGIIDEGKVAGKVNFIVAFYDIFEDSSVFLF